MEFKGICCIFLVCLGVYKRWNGKERNMQVYYYTLYLLFLFSQDKDKIDILLPVHQRNGCFFHFWEECLGGNGMGIPS